MKFSLYCNTEYNLPFPVVEDVDVVRDAGVVIMKEIEK